MHALHLNEKALQNSRNMCTYVAIYCSIPNEHVLPKIGRHKQFAEAAAYVYCGSDG